MTEPQALPTTDRYARAGTLLGRLAWVLLVVVLAGVAALLVGWFEGREPIVAGWYSPPGTHVVLRLGNGEVRTVATDNLRDVVATRTYPGRFKPLVWAPRDLLVVLTDRSLSVLSCPELQERTWIEPPPDLPPLFALEGETLLAILPGQAEYTFHIRTWETGRREARPGTAHSPSTQGIVFADDTSIKTQEDGAAVLEPPQVDPPRRIAVRRPVLWRYVALMATALVLFTLRRLRTWCYRQAYLRSRLVSDSPPAGGPSEPPAEPAS